MDNNKFRSISVIEANVLDKITREKKITRQSLVDDLKLADSSADIILNKLLSTNVIKMVSNDTYEYIEPLNDDVVILEGQLLLPVSVINEGATKIVSRGSKWYRFDKDFDIRRIIWNVDMIENAGNEKNQTLVDLLKSSIVKEKRTVNVHLEEYDYLKNKIIPFNHDIGLHMVRIGADVTDINILFKIYLEVPNTDIGGCFKGFGARSEVSTIEIISELNKESGDRNYENIRIDRQIDINDILFTGNEIPVGFYKDAKCKEKETKVSITGEYLKIIKITKIKKSFDFDIISVDPYNVRKVLGNYSYESISEGIEAMLELCKPFIDLLYRKNDFVLDIC